MKTNEDKPELRQKTRGKHNLAHMPSLKLTRTLSIESRFPIFIINSYDRKKQTLVLLVLIVCFP